MFIVKLVFANMHANVAKLNKREQILNSCSIALVIFEGEHVLHLSLKELPQLKCIDCSPILTNLALKLYLPINELNSDISLIRKLTGNRCCKFINY